MRLRTRGRIAIIAAFVTVATLGLASPASAETYPSWDDVKNAKNNEAAKQSQIESVTGLIDQLAAASDAAQATAATAAQEYSEALQVALDAEAKSADLATQLADAEVAAAASKKQVGALFAKLGRMNNVDVTAEIFVDSGNADNALYKLGAISKLSGKQAVLFETAEKDANQVKSLSSQAEVAAGVLEQARADAEVKLEAAEAAAQAAASALAEQQAHQSELIEQLAFLKDTTAEVEQQYAIGEQKRKEEEARKAAEAAAAAAKAEADRRAAAAQGGGGGGGGAVNYPAPPASSGGGSGTYFSPSAAGWYRPLPGPITSLYGNRPQICTPGGCSTPGWHSGLDFGGACGSQIKAIGSGTVVYAQYGYNSGHGNRVMVNHGGVTSTYGHIQAGGIRVSPGQQVAAGQVVGLVGSTGVSSGCHLDLKINDGNSNPLPFLRSVGVAV